MSEYFLPYVIEYGVTTVEQMVYSVNFLISDKIAYTICI